MPSGSLDKTAFIHEVDRILSELNANLDEVGSSVFGRDIYRGEIWTLSDFEERYPGYAEDASNLLERYPAFDDRGLPALLFERLSDFAEQTSEAYDAAIGEIQQLTPPPGDEAIVEELLAP